jgi:hypothetical protein
VKRTFIQITFNNPGRVILHHGCGRGADEVAHRFARERGNWRIRGHPRKADHHQPHSQTILTRELDEIAGGKPGRERDADIVNASDIVVVVLPYTQPSVWELLQAATRTGREVIYIPSAEPQPSPETGKKTPEQLNFPANPATPAEKIQWADLQGKADRAKGATCPDYRVFCAKFGIPGSALAQQMWSAYTRPTPTRNQRTPGQLRPSERAAAPPQRPNAVGTATSHETTARPIKRPVAESTVKATSTDRHGIPAEWYEIAVRTLGATAEVSDDGGPAQFVLKGGGKVLAKYPVPRGTKAAASSATAFNREIAKRKMNPPLTEAWR